MPVERIGIHWQHEQDTLACTEGSNVCWPTFKPFQTSSLYYIHCILQFAIVF